MALGELRHVAVVREDPSPVLERMAVEHRVAPGVALRTCASTVSLDTTPLTQWKSASLSACAGLRVTWGAPST